MAEAEVQDNHHEDAADVVVQGIFVHVVDVEGGYRVEFEFIGGFDPLRAPTVLELAAKAARLHVGLPSA